jgi:hypothetical protein
MRRLGWERLMRARAVSSGSGTSSSTQPQRVGLMVNFDPSSCQISSAPPSITKPVRPLSMDSMPEVSSDGSA